MKVGVMEFGLYSTAKTKQTVSKKIPDKLAK